MARNSSRTPAVDPPPLPRANAASVKPGPGIGPPFSVVCAGASAGGLEPLNRMLGALPADTGMAFVVILHMDPKHDSRLAEILARSTTMPVGAVDSQSRLQPDRVYVAPADKMLSLSDGRFILEPRTESRAQRRPIDHFMCSLAEELGHKAIGVVLSGMASDGTRGLEEIKAAGGITFAQDNTAEQTSMPRSAIAAGCVDFVLSPEDIGREIARIARHPYVAPSGDDADQSHEQIGGVLDLVRRRCGIDFANYKRNTLRRRIRRRVVLHKLDGVPEYVQLLQDNPLEVDALCRDILINVTSFFRNPEAYEALKTTVFPPLTADKNRPDPVRVWTLGCSTGEEAYSIAMAYTEYAEANGLRVPMQIFATDLNGAGIERARSGIYPKGISQDVSPERLRRFFIEVEGSYRVCKPIRDMCVFARQNVLSDPPFSRMDVIACRNMLIYLEPVLQQKLLPILHYALRPRGWLWLGSSETIGSFRDLFELDDAKHKIYAKRPESTRSVQLPLAAHVPEASNSPARVERSSERQPDPQKEADRLLLARYAPPAVVVNHDLDIIQFRGDTSAFLTPAPGRASLNLLKMLREGLLVAVRGAVHKARREDALVRESGLRANTGNGMRDVDLVVTPLKGAGTSGCLLVMFEEPAMGAETQARLAEAQAQRVSSAGPAESMEQELARTKQELAATRDYLQSVIEQQEAANEELQSANEEIQSTNEELQSINEELETSKEEIQSSNEELATVNDELQHRNQELSQSNNDLTNLLSSVQMAIVMLGPDLRIRRFTPAAEKMFNLIPADVGRPIGDIKLRLSITDLEPLLAEAIDAVTVRELEVRDQDGRWFLLRIRPYKTLENKIDGAVLILIDVDTLKRAEQALLENDRAKNEFLAMLAHELRNPLAALSTSLALMMDSRAGGDAVRLAQDVMHRQAAHMKRLLDDLLDASRLTQGGIALERAPVELAPLINGAIEATEHLRRAHGQQLSASLPSQSIVVRGDATRLEQVFCNLLTNASKFTPAGGHIWISAVTEPVVGRDSTMRRRAVVQVRDNGRGIDPAMLPRIFDLFVQIDPSIDRQAGGLGIGLALARRLVDLHGGTIDATSEGRGRGSEFVVRLPLAARDDHPAEASNHAQANPGR